MAAARPNGCSAWAAGRGQGGFDGQAEGRRARVWPGGAEAGPSAETEHPAELPGEV